jgi:hypothetical protein
MPDLRLVRELNDCLQAARPRCGCGAELELVGYRNGLSAIGEGEHWWFFDQEKYRGDGPGHDVFVSSFDLHVSSFDLQSSSSVLGLKFKRTRVGMCQK